jgi:type IV secretion system protein VirB10
MIGAIFAQGLFVYQNRAEEGGTMRLWRATLAATILLILLVSARGFGLSQASAQPETAAISSAREPAAVPANDPAGAAQSAEPSQSVPAKKTYTVPAGTKVLLQLRSAVNTKSAKPGDGVYLASTFPVVVGNRVMIPAGVYVQGVVDRVARAGHVKGRAQLDMHFTSIIFPNGTVVEIPGIINSLPGAKDRTVKGDEGTVEQQGNKGRDVARAAEIGLEGAGIGAVGGSVSGHPLEGAAIGGLGGVAVGAAVALFTRGEDINIESGTPVEMVLQRPLILEEENLGGITAPGAAPGFTPVANQPRPIAKPNRARVLCPAGGLGCG